MERKPVPHYLEFSRKEKNGIVICMAIILFLIWLPAFYEKIYPPVVPSQKEIMESYLKLDSNSEKNNQPFQRKYNYNNNYHQIEKHSTKKMPLSPFPFDPNKLSFEGWQEMGLKEKTIKTILNYTSKGGKFRELEDIKKIWGITEEQADQLIPYVKINEENSPATKSNQYNTSIRKFPDKILDINTCDSAALERLPCIGAGLARRIINYRERLGGFYSVLQIGEVYGLPDSAFQKIKLQLSIVSKTLKKININKALLEELKLHPYIKYKLANTIIQYRNQHGNFRIPADLKKILILDDDTYNKVLNYITFE